MRNLQLILVLILVGLFALTGCRKGAPVYNPTMPIEYGAELSQKDVEKAIILACPKTGWVPRKVDDNTIQATLNVRAHVAIVDITFDSDSYTITYKGSNNLKYNGETIHPNYNSWIKNLNNNINAELALQTID